MAANRLIKNLWFAYVCVLLCWAVQAYLLVGQYMQEGTLFARIEDGRPYISDFAMFYSMGNLADQCMRQHVNVYDPDIQAATERIFTAPVVAEVPFICPYPPWFFSLLLPFSRLPMAYAFLLWDGLGIICAIAAIRLLAFDFHQSTFSRAFILAAFCASFPTWICLRLGQTSMFIFAALGAFWWLIAQRRSFLAGLAVGAITLKVQYLPLPFLIGLILDRFKFLLGFVTVTALLLASALVTVGWSNIVSYPQAVWSIDGARNVSGVAPEVMQNLRGMLVLIMQSDGHLVHMIVVLFLLIVLGVGSALFFRHSPKDFANDPDFKIKASICSLLMLIASPHTHVQDYVVATIPALWLWEVTATRKAPALRALILSFPVVSWIFFVLRPLFTLLRVQPFFIWAVVIVFLASKLLVKPVAVSAETGNAPLTASE